MNILVNFPMYKSRLFKVGKRGAFPFNFLSSTLILNSFFQATQASTSKVKRTLKHAKDKKQKTSYRKRPDVATAQLSLTQARRYTVLQLQYFCFSKQIFLTTPLYFHVYINECFRPRSLRLTFSSKHRNCIGKTCLWKKKLVHFLWSILILNTSKHK